MQIGEEGLLRHVGEVRTAATITATVFKDGYLYAAAGKGGIEIYRVDIPEQASLHNIIKVQPSVNDLCLDKKTLFTLTYRTNEVGLYSLGDPAAPELYHLIKLKEKIFDIAVMEQRLFVATSSGLSIYRIDDEGIPHFFRQVGLLGPGKKLYLGNDRLYVVDSYSGVAIIDPLTGDIISTPQLRSVHSVTAAGGYLYLTGESTGLTVVATGKINPNRRARSLQTNGQILDLIEYNGRMFAAGICDGVLVADLASSQREQGFTQITTAASTSLAIKGHHLFVAQRDAGIEVFDISDVDNPVSVAQWPDLPDHKIAIFDSYLVVYQSNPNCLSLVDISDLQHPQVVDARTDTDISKMAVSGDNLLAVSQKLGLLAFRLSHQKLVRVGRLYTPFPMNRFDQTLSVAVYEGVAYVSNGRSGVLVVDVENPAEMKVLSALSVPGYNKGVYVHANRLYVMTHLAGLTLFDLESPASPKLLGQLDMPGLSSRLLATAGDLYMPRSAGGMLVVSQVNVAEKIRRFSANRLEVQLRSPDERGTYGIQLSNGNGSVELNSTIEFFDPDSLSPEPGSLGAQNL
jgi:hypothetical protein